MGEYNKKLARDGWEIVEAEKISGKSRFILQKVGQLAQVFDEPVGWEKVKRQIRNAYDQLQTAEAEEHFQSVGLCCREALISVAQEVYEPLKHETQDGVPPSQTDAKRMLEAFSLRNCLGKPMKTSEHSQGRLSVWQLPCNTTAVQITAPRLFACR